MPRQGCAVLTPQSANLALTVRQALSANAGAMLSRLFSDPARWSARPSSTMNGGTSWTYVPQPAGDGCDSAVTNFRVKPTGSLAANGKFTLRARYRIN